MHDGNGFEDRINNLMNGLTKAQLARRVVEMERHNDPDFACTTDLLVQLERTKDVLARVGICPECLTVPEHRRDEPFSSCMCGEAEDYAKRPLQAIQVDVSANYAKLQLEKFRAELQEIP